MYDKAALIVLLAGAAQAEVRFQPIDVPNHVYDGGWAHFVGGGLASFDCNGDTLPELFAAGGETPGSLMRNTSEVGGALSFEEDTPDALAVTGLTGAYPLDIDGDGMTDLVLLSQSANQILLGGPDCSFSPYDGLDLSGDARWTTAFSATWDTGQSLPTLAFGNYVDRTDPDGPFGTCDANTVYRPIGETYGPAIELTPGYCALSMLFSDWSRSARPDLRISNDRHYYVQEGAEQLWRLEDTPRELTASDGWIAHKLWGMGIASRDVTGDGRPEVYLSSMGDQRLQVLADGGTPTWTDAPFDWGTTAHRPHIGDDGRPSTGWHTAFGDVQNDGLDDIFVSKGNVEQMPGLAMEDPNSLLIAIAPHRWREAAGTAGVASLHRGRGAALVDLNKDGLLDLAVVNRRAPLEVWQNVSAAKGAFLSLKLTQDAPNRDAIGAWIEVETPSGLVAREVTVGGGHAGGSLGAEHFGLGPDASAVRLRVIWPDGAVSDWHSTPTNAHVLITRDGTTLALSDH